MGRYRHMQADIRRQRVRKRRRRSKRTQAQACAEQRERGIVVVDHTGRPK